MSIDPDQFAQIVGPALHERSGKVFYSGRSAFSSPSRLYILGLNPGGSAATHAGDTIGRNLTAWSERSAQWSEYCDERWEGAEPGTYGMAPRVLHLFRRLGLDPRDVPASNVMFVRSNNEAALTKEKANLLASCWPVHRAIIDTLAISIIACFGGTAGRWVRSLLAAHDPAGRFVEQNSRKWVSEAHANRDGICVLTLTHPSRADWTNPKTDPSGLVRNMLGR